MSQARGASSVAPFRATGDRARPYRVVAVTSNKGGVGKTTFALNLAVYARALYEELPVLVLSLDDQDTLDRMFALPGSQVRGTTAAGLRVGSFASGIELGQYGVHYVPTSTHVSDLKLEVSRLSQLDEALARTRFEGLVIVDTKSDLEILTRNAVAASDLAVVVVKDLASLREADRLFAMTDDWGRPRERMRVLLSLIDLRVKYREGHPDVLALLLAGLRERGYDNFPTFLARSPSVEALSTNPSQRPLSILHGAGRSVVHYQMQSLTRDVLEQLGRLPPEGRRGPPEPAQAPRPPRPRPISAAALAPPPPAPPVGDPRSLRLSPPGEEASARVSRDPGRRSRLGFRSLFRRRRG